MVLLFTSMASFSQNLYVYHGRNGETAVYLKDEKSSSVRNYDTRLDQGKKVSIRIMNPNPLFYKYTIKSEEQKSESENEDVTNALSVLSGILIPKMPAGAAAGVVSPEPTYEAYKEAINELLNDIKVAQKYIKDSDKPEEAFSTSRISGYVGVIDKINEEISAEKNRFNSSTLSTDLTALLNAVVTSSIDAVSKKAFELLNESLVQKVKDIKASVPLRANRYLDSELLVTDKTTKVYLVITPIDSTNKSLLRDTFSESKKLEITTIIPNFKRATMELVPVGTFHFAKDVQEFYLDNNIVKSRDQTKTTFVPSMVINVNATRFGPSKEMAVGVGLGYRLSSDSKALNSLFFSSLFSYKDFLRVGFGFGKAEFPNKLKGAELNQPLPANISNLDDIIEYKDKMAVFFNVSFTGLNLTKKK